MTDKNTAPVAQIDLEDNAMRIARHLREDGATDDAETIENLIALACAGQQVGQQAGDVAGDVKGKTAAEWYVAYCEKSEALKAANGALTRYSNELAELKVKLTAADAERLAARRALAFTPDAQVEPGEIERTIVGLYEDMKASRAKLSAAMLARGLSQTELAAAMSPDASPAAADPVLHTSAELAVAVSPDTYGANVIVSLKRGDHIAVLYRGHHPAHRDTLARVELPNMGRAPAPAPAQTSGQIDLNMIDDITEHIKANGLWATGEDLLRMTAEARAAAPAAQAQPSYWNSQRKIIERAIIGLRDGWATRKDADDALAALGAAPDQKPPYPTK